jgi:ABC-2 type transport system ATP-binding protein
MGETALEAHGLAKAFGEIRAVEALDLAVPPGVVLGFLGPNGAGKTTAIRMLTTVLQPDAGTFTVAGVHHTRPTELRQRVGVLPESAGYPERQTGEEFLLYHARLFGHTRGSARETARSLLAETGLTDRASSAIGGYSRGMRQRLGIARALVNEPAVVFLDEPTLGLDPSGQRQMLGLVREIAEARGATVVLSTHLLAEVEEICGRVVILNRGRIVADGTVAEIVRRAAAPRQGCFSVPPEQAPQALEALRAQGLEATTNARPGELDLALRAENSDDIVRAALRALLDAGIPVIGLELEGGRLSDAFLAMTERT